MIKNNHFAASKYVSVGNNSTFHFFTILSKNNVAHSFSDALSYQNQINFQM